MTAPGGIESAEMAAERELLLRSQQMEEEEAEEYGDNVPACKNSSDNVSMADQEGTGRQY